MQDQQWPLRVDFLECIASPATYSRCFTSEDLKQATPVLRGSEPKNMSGGFAIVCNLETPQKAWAVRFFVNADRLGDRYKRYQEIGQYFKSSNIQHLVPFEFLEKGILIRGSWYPLLKMEWISGVNLRQYIKDNINDSNKLRLLANNWKDMCNTLRSCRIAHGDLHPDNVIMSRHGMKLVDYDGVFVPRLGGFGPTTRGLPNYQHPNINASNYFGAELDNFSSILIYTSILTLSYNPQLWEYTGTHKDDKKLIFQSSDFVTQSPIIAQAMSLNEEIKICLTALQKASKNLPEQTPPLNEVLKTLPRSHSTVTAQRPPVAQRHQITFYSDKSSSSMGQRKPSGMTDAVLAWVMSLFTREHFILWTTVAVCVIYCFLLFPLGKAAILAGGAVVTIIGLFAILLLCLKILEIFIAICAFFIQGLNSLHAYYMQNLTLILFTGFIASVLFLLWATYR